MKTNKYLVIWSVVVTLVLLFGAAYIVDTNKCKCTDKCIVCNCCE